MARVPVLWSDGVVTLVEKVGLLEILSCPRADRLRLLPLTPTASVPLEFGTDTVLLAVRVAWEKVLLKPLAVPSRNLITPVLPLALPTVRPLVPCSAKVLKVTAELVAMSCLVLMAPRVLLKLVELKLASPLVPAVLALSMVMLVPDVRALLNVRLPLMLVDPAVVPVMSTTPPPAPPPLDRQVGQVRLPVVASRTRGPDALTATVPLVLGSLIATLPLGAAARDRVVVKALVELLRMKDPLLVLGTPTARLPAAVTVLPDSLRIELVMSKAAVYLAIRLTMPPPVVTAPPTPEQLPTVVQMK